MASFQSWQSRDSLFAGLWHRRRRASSGRERPSRKGLAAPPQSCGFGPAGIEPLEPRQMLATLYWDPDQNAANNDLATGAGLGGAGTWSDAGGKVWLDPTLNAGKGGYVSWKNASGDKAVFLSPATTTTVTISGTVSAAEIEFGTAGFKVTGGDFTTPTGGTTFSAKAAGEFNTPISGTGGITKTGSATLTLGAPFNAYTGTTQVSAGTLSVSGTIQSHVQVTGGSVSGVMFYDPDLASAVREALALDPKAVLTPALLSQSAALTSLTVDGNGVGDLKGIASLTALTSLELLPSDHAATPQGIKSLAPLSGLTNLTNLSLNHVGLTDAVLATLPALSGLKRLDVRYNDLKVLTDLPLAGVPRLGSLLVHGNSSLTDSPQVGLAALAGKAIDVDVAPDRPDIATNIDDLAARLYKLPLKMLEYVTNTVAYQPYVGAMKGPLATLLTKAGNDWDTNSLLAGLFTQAGSATRYVAGEIQLTAQQLANYVGTRDPAAAVKILNAAGITTTYDIERKLCTFSHTWLEARVYDPAKGAQAWVPLDASWKLRDYRPGLPGVLANVSFSPLEAEYLTNPVWQKKSTAEYYEAQVATWLAEKRPGFTIADVGYDGPIRQQAFKALPTELPFSTVSQNQVQDPTAYNWKVHIKLASGDSQLFGSDGKDLSVADVSLKRLTIDPGLVGTGSSQTAQPVLRQDGATIVTAPTAFAAIASNGSMNQLTLAITVRAPGGGFYTRSFTRAADRFIAIGLNANQFSESLLVGKRAVVNAQQLNQANGATVANEQAVGGLLDLACDRPVFFGRRRRRGRACHAHIGRAGPNTCGAGDRDERRGAFRFRVRHSRSSVSVSAS